MSGTYHSVKFQFKEGTYLSIVDQFGDRMYDALKKPGEITQDDDDLTVYVCGWFTDEFVAIVREHLTMLEEVSWEVDTGETSGIEYWKIENGVLSWCDAAPDNDWREYRVPIMG